MKKGGEQQRNGALFKHLFLRKIYAILIDNLPKWDYNHNTIDMYLWLNWIELPATDRTVGGSNPSRYAKATLQPAGLLFCTQL